MNTIIRSTILTALVVLTSFAAARAAQQSTPSTGELRVKVLISGTMEPLAGASVTVGSGGSSLPAILTRADGLATLSNLTFGSYVVRVSHDGYFFPPQTTTALSPGYATARITGPQPAEISVVLSPNGSVSGRVLDANGMPMPNATVMVGEIGYNSGRRVFNSQGNAPVDGRGNYEITPRGGTGEFYIRLGPAARGSGGTYYPGVADIKEAVRIPVQPGQRVVGIDFKMSNPKLYKVSGKVLNLPPHTLPNGQQDNTVSNLTFVSADPEYVDTQTTPLRTNERPGPNGEFELSLPPGLWDIFPVINMRQVTQAPAVSLAAQGPVYATGRARVLVQDKNVENVTITIAAEDISGRIVAEGTSESVLRTMRVTLASVDNIPSPLISHLRNIASNTVSSNGAFSFQAAPPGRYVLEITPLPSGYYIAGERVGTRSIYSDGIINVGTDPMDPIEVTLRSGGGTVRENFETISQNAPRPIARYVLVPSGANHGNSLLYQASNQAAFVNVAPGDYKVFSFEAPIPNSAERNEEFLKKYERFGVPVHVDAGQAVFFEVTPIPADQ
jgi:hypothetical protein